MAEDEDYDLEYSEDSNRYQKLLSFRGVLLTISVNLTWTWRTNTTTAKAWRRKIPKLPSKAFKECSTLKMEKRVNSVHSKLKLNWNSGEWGFKALKQMIKINFRLSNFGEMMTRCEKQFHTIISNYIYNKLRYKQLLTYIKSAVTRNHSEKSINSILDYISTSKQVRVCLFIECWRV